VISESASDSRPLDGQMSVIDSMTMSAPTPE
jgi:hypothetical protein